MRLNKVNMYGLFVAVGSEILMYLVVAGVFKLAEVLTKFDTGFGFWQAFGFLLAYVTAVRIILYPFRRQNA